MIELKPHIYLFRRIRNDQPVYIGQHNGTDIEYFTSGIILIQNMKSWGKEKFWNYYKKEIICYCKVEELNNLEIEYIKRFNTLRSNNSSSYNFSKGGNGGNTRRGFSKEQRKEYSRKLRKFAASRSEEYREAVLEKGRTTRESWSDKKKKRVQEKRSENMKLVRSKQSLEKKREITRKQQKSRSITILNRTKEQKEETRRRNRQTREKWDDKKKESFLKKRRKTLSLRPVLICPHCSLESKSRVNMNRWHFDNCKENKVSA